MSTILDALRKSEQERKLNKLPTLTDMQAPQEPSRWPLMIAIALSALLLLALVIAFTWWHARSSQSSEVALEPVVSEFENVVSEAADPATPDNEDGVVVNVISYSDELAQRFAMVNKKMVREGEFVEAGLIVEKINADSVVLNLRGKQITRKP